MMRRSRRRSAGFTLLEMMVALVAGAIAIASIYYVSAASSHHFQEQQRVAQTQMGLRMAMEQLRRDIQRAGYLSSPNSLRDQTCMTPPAQVVGVAFEDDPRGGDVVDPDDVNGAEADRLVLTGNYVTSDAYLAIGLSAGGDTIFFQRNWQSFRRTFGPSDTGEYSEAAFEDVFRQGRFLHIENRQGNHFFVEVTGANAAQAAVRINPALPVGGHCVVGLADGAVVSPITRVEYSVVDPASIADLANLVSTSAALGINGPVLMRRELEVDSETPVTNTERVAAEYVAEFDVDFVVDDQVGDGLPPSLQLRVDGDAQGYLAPAANPHRVRAARVRLSLRSSREDPRFSVVPRLPGGPLLSFDVEPDVPGAARVRTATAEVFMPNIANRAIRP